MIINKLFVMTPLPKFCHVGGVPSPGVTKKHQKFIFEYWVFSQKSYLNVWCFEKVHICIPKIPYLHTYRPCPNFSLPCISESKVFPCLQCVSSDRKNQNIRHSWKRLWILTRAWSQINTGVNFRILPKIVYQNICLIVPFCNTCKRTRAYLFNNID